MSELISDDDQDSVSDDFPPAAAVALAVCLTAVVVIVVVFVWRTRKSRRRPEARKLLYASGPHKPRIWTCPELASVLMGAGDGKRRGRCWIKRFSRSAFSPYFSRTYNDHESEKSSKQESLLWSPYCLYTYVVYFNPTVCHFYKSTVMSDDKILALKCARRRGGWLSFLSLNLKEIKPGFKIRRLNRLVWQALISRVQDVLT